MHVGLQKSRQDNASKQTGKQQWQGTDLDYLSDLGRAAGWQCHDMDSNLGLSVSLVTSALAPSFLHIHLLALSVFLLPCHEHVPPGAPTAVRVLSAIGRGKRNQEYFLLIIDFFTESGVIVAF
ncbi:Serine/Threonine-Protein Kinase Haspin [Manis pentadactyla]|nr:Serine/Threonine-Protein Kinase Haspin [Manis pentadactyla]